MWHEQDRDQHRLLITVCENDFKVLLTALGDGDVSVLRARSGSPVEKETMLPGGPASRLQLEAVLGRYRG
jgi:hypothetical protein